MLTSNINVRIKKIVVQREQQESERVHKITGIFLMALVLDELLLKPSIADAANDLKREQKMRVKKLTIARY